MERISSAVLIVLIFSYPVVASVAQHASGFETGTSGSATGGYPEMRGPRTFSEEDGPVPYEPEEFPKVLRDLRRFEIVSLGSLPLTLLFSSLGYRLHRISTEEEISWQSSGNFSVEQRGRVLTIGLSASLAVGVLDFILGRFEEDTQ